MRLLGVAIWNPTYEEFRAWFNEASQDRSQATLLGIVNAHTLNLAAKAPQYKSCLMSMDRLINDGIGVRLGARMRGQDFNYNFNGTDLWPRLLAEATPGLRVFLYGSTEVSNAGAAAAILERYPSVEVVGRLNGYDSSPEQVIAALARADADILLVALGQPRQEQFLCQHARELRVGLACGIGALFDFLSGSVPRAPAGWRRLKLEWAYRLLREPRRMFGRYVVGNPLFLARAWVWRSKDRPRD